MLSLNLLIRTVFHILHMDPGWDDLHLPNWYLSPGPFPIMSLVLLDSIICLPWLQCFWPLPVESMNYLVTSPAFSLIWLGFYLPYICLSEAISSFVCRCKIIAVRSHDPGPLAYAFSRLWTAFVPWYRVFPKAPCSIVMLLFRYLTSPLQ